MTDKSNQPTSLTPHIALAYYNWLCENNARTYIEVATDYPGVSLAPAIKPHIYTDTRLFLMTPEQEQQLIKEMKRDGVEVKRPENAKPAFKFEFKAVRLNITPDAISSFASDSKAMWFKARFSGVSYDLYIPWEAIYAIYCPDPDFNHGYFQPRMEFDDHVRNIYEAISKPEIREDMKDVPPVRTSPSMTVATPGGNKERPVLKRIK